VDDWILDRPDAIVAAHRAFVAAGAQIVLAGTFRALPSVQPRWRDVARAAVALARRAAPRAVWASVGPTDQDPAELAALVDWVARDVDGVVLETFVDPDAARRAVAAVRRVWRGPLVASLVPDDAGRLQDEMPHDDALGALIDAGADGAGFNCGTGPASVALAVQQTTVSPLWARPAGGPGAVGVLRSLRARCRWLGGCCGVDADTLRAALQGV